MKIKNLLTILSIVWIGWIMYTLSFSFVTFNLLYFIVGQLIIIMGSYTMGRHDIIFQLKQQVLNWYAKVAAKFNQPS